MFVENISLLCHKKQEHIADMCIIKTGCLKSHPIFN